MFDFFRKLLSPKSRLVDEPKLDASKNPWAIPVPTNVSSAVKIHQKRERLNSDESIRQAVEIGADLSETGSIEIYRTEIGGELDFSNLILRNSYFGRSEIQNVNFYNSDLRGSTLCWNDFHDTVFAESDLSESDLRASYFQGVDFQNCNLTNADMRRSNFNNCMFQGASMGGAKIMSDHKDSLSLSENQITEIDWHKEEGPEPEGG